jgi:hypothetical protein
MFSASCCTFLSARGAIKIACLDTAYLLLMGLHRALVLAFYTNNAYHHWTMGKAGKRYISDQMPGWNIWSSISTHTVVVNLQCSFG